MLLEKAWAKVNGSYENTITGLPADALRALTGAPVDFYAHDYTSDEDLWNVVIEAHRNNHIICGSSATDQNLGMNSTITNFNPQISIGDSVGKDL